MKEYLYSRVWLKSPVVLLPLGVLILSLIAISAYLIIKQIRPELFFAPITNTVNTISSNQVLRREIKEVFDSTEEKAILAYLGLSSAEKSPLQSYQYLKTVFVKMTDSYKKANTEEKKKVMVKLRTYAASLQFFKESDFVIPK